jgi:hypothetical protein
LANYISPYYSYGYHQELFASNFNPVPVELLVKDGVTLAPVRNNKRQTGRPPSIRLRKRFKFSNTDESPIICANCKRKGHNRRTCARFHELERLAALNDENLPSLDLS